MPSLKDLVKHALEEQPTNFKETFDEIMTNRIVDIVDARKEEIAANMFGESVDDEDLDDLDDLDLDLDDITDEDLEDLDIDDILTDDEEEDFDDDEEVEESFNEEGPAVKECLGNIVRNVTGKIKQGLENEIARAQTSREQAARDKNMMSGLKAKYGTTGSTPIYKIRSRSIKAGNGDK